ncbi:hypothetical protein [uncultured Thiodictyon sp.]|uniref:hypothetical protein n=1 Tax=uncultured Thiodictyon sp. TaxID=1846217 RepID=UPI0025F2FE9C|nr:hypothetical protein [uncultured Thiodictyon sp.]
MIAGSTALGRILNSHLTATWRNLPVLPGREAPYVAQALLGVLAAQSGCPPAMKCTTTMPSIWPRWSGFPLRHRCP